MNRRRFLGGGVVLGAAVGLPLVIRRAFFSDESTSAVASSDASITLAKTYHAPSTASWLKAQLEASRALKKPLLVLLVPEKDRAERGHAWGELLNHGDEAQLAPLALCEVVCATFSSVHEGLGVSFDGESSWAALIETDGSNACVLAEPKDMPRYKDVLESKKVLANEMIRERIMKMSALVRDLLLLKRPEVIERRAAYSLEDTPEEIAAELMNKIEVGLTPAKTSVNRYAAVLYQANKYQGALAALVKEKLCQQRIPGSKWVMSTSCGSIVEGEEGTPRGIACGMGHTNEKSRRFLRFISDNDAI